MLIKLFRTLLTLSLAALPALASAQLVNFAQFDVSRDARTLALVRALPDGNPQTPDPLLTAGYTRWDTGSSSSAAYIHRWALNSGPHNWAVGAGVGVNHYESRNGAEERTGGSLRGQTELSGPLPGGTYFALLQLSTFRSGAFGLLQYNVANSPIGVDLSHYRETGVKQTTLAVRYALDARKRWSLRTGVIESQSEMQPFIGIAYNAF
ncbi:MAG TPA: hypothetical protein VM183_06795 [Burkholderiales bacterium]|nr:hypothetical protein [Burkholderiales bacterium]